MNKQEYNNVIETTVAQQTGKKDSLETTREVLNNMGVVLPQGDLKQVSEGLATDDYMGWRKCTVKEAQEYANVGTAVVAISDEQIALVAANEDEGQAVATSSAVMTLDETTPAIAVADTTFYANSRSGTTVAPETLFRPRLFNVLYNNYYISILDVKSTTDGLDILTCSLAEIMKNAGTYTLYDGGNHLSVDNFYDDWYIYAIETDAAPVYGLYKMREQENDDGDNNDPGVTISFIEFDCDLFFSFLFDPYDLVTQKELSDHINYVVASLNFESHNVHNNAIKNYFSNAENKGAYLIAEEYVKYIGSLAHSGYINTPNNYKTLDSDHRVKQEAERRNQLAQYDLITNEKIYISSELSLTTHEKYAILLTHTANVNFNSFAAEVVFHARALTDMFSGLDWYYNAAIRADMAIGEEEEYVLGLGDDYYDLESSLVREQVRYHGEK